MPETQFGVMGVAANQVVLGVLAFFLNAHYSGVHVRYGAWRQLKDVVPIFLAAGVMGGVVFAIGEVMRLHPALELLVQVAAGVAIYGAICHLLRFEAYSEARRLLLDYSRRATPQTPA